MNKNFSATLLAALALTSTQIFESAQAMQLEALQTSDSGFETDPGFATNPQAASQQRSRSGFATNPQAAPAPVSGSKNFPETQFMMLSGYFYANYEAFQKVKPITDLFFPTPINNGTFIEANSNPEQVVMNYFGEMSGINSSIQQQKSQYMKPVQSAFISDMVRGYYSGYFILTQNWISSFIWDLVLSDASIMLNDWLPSEITDGWTLLALSTLCPEANDAYWYFGPQPFRVSLSPNFQRVKQFIPQVTKPGFKQDNQGNMKLSMVLSADVTIDISGWSQWNKEWYGYPDDATSALIFSSSMGVTAVAQMFKVSNNIGWTNGEDLHFAIKDAFISDLVIQNWQGEQFPSMETTILSGQDEFRQLLAENTPGFSQTLNNPEVPIWMLCAGLNWSYFQWQPASKYMEFAFADGGHGLDQHAACESLLSGGGVWFDNLFSQIRGLASGHQDKIDQLEYTVKESYYGMLYWFIRDNVDLYQGTYPNYEYQFSNFFDAVTWWFGDFYTQKYPGNVTSSSARKSFRQNYYNWGIDWAYPETMQAYMFVANSEVWKAIQPKLHEIVEENVCQDNGVRYVSCNP